jgi:hypothetical protein
MTHSIIAGLLRVPLNLVYFAIGVTALMGASTLTALKRVIR